MTQVQSIPPNNYNLIFTEKSSSLIPIITSNKTITFAYFVENNVATLAME